MNRIGNEGLIAACAADKLHLMLELYDQIEAAIQAKKLPSERDLIEAAPEETYETACRGTKEMRCPTWLAICR